MKYSALSRFALVGLLVATGSLCASTHYSRKTFLSSRAAGVNLPMEYTTWHDHVYKGKTPRAACATKCVKACSRPCNHPVASLSRHSLGDGRCAPKPECCPKKLKAHVQVTGFYQDSTNHAEIGEYFGIGNGKNSFIVGNNAAVLAGTADIENSFLIHDAANPGTGPLAGTVSFNPHQQMAGVRFDYFQDFNTPFCGLFFKARMPLVWVERDMKLRVAGSVRSNAPGSFSLEDFFKGNANQTAPAEDVQLPLTKAKINGRRHKFGVADIDLALGYKFFHSDTRHLFFNIGITIPTGNKVRGEFLFEPVCGNGKHFGLGGGIDAGAEIWCNQHAALHILAAAEYRYLFEGTETRTPGVKNIPFGQYFAAGTINAPAGTALQPAANFITQGFRIRPGSQLDSLIALAFKSGGFVLDVGYNMFWKDGEGAWLKNWKDGVYALADKDFDVSGGSFTGTIGVDSFQLLNQANLDVEAAKTPSLFTHKLFGGLGYTSKLYNCYPVSFGVGGSYEFATTNADLENYAVWVKTMVSF